MAGRCAMTATEETYVIWSHEHGAWWRPGGHGYTPRLSEAGHYTRDGALLICIRAVPGTSSMLGALPELPVRLADVRTVIAAYDAEYGERPEPWR